MVTMHECSRKVHGTTMNSSPKHRVIFKIVCQWNRNYPMTDISPVIGKMLFCTDPPKCSIPVSQVKQFDLHSDSMPHWKGLIAWRSDATMEMVDAGQSTHRWHSPMILVSSPVKHWAISPWISQTIMYTTGITCLKRCFQIHAKVP